MRKFQEIFDLTVDGIVGKATWYAMVRLYTAVTRLSELRSQGQRFYSNSWAAEPLNQGDQGIKVEHLQYMLSVLSAYIPEIPSVTVDGIYGSATRNAVIAAQRRFGLPQTGEVDFNTWDEIYDQFAGIENTSFLALPASEGAVQAFAANRQRPRNSQNSTMTQFPGRNLRQGQQDPIVQEGIR